METMLEYGMMQDWDERVRAWEREKRGDRAVTVASGNGDGLVEAGVFCPWARQ
jgi:ubiquinone/menaquinone biosynthesis C-methylase UbiE